MARLPPTATVEPWLVVDDSSSLLAWRSIKVTAVPTVISRPAVACNVLVALMPDARATRDCDAV